MSTKIRDRIAAIDAFGRELANRVNERVVEEGLVGQTPATIRRVEELIQGVLNADRKEESPEWNRGHYEFHIVRGGIAAKPLVTLHRYTGRVGP